MVDAAAFAAVYVVIVAVNATTHSLHFGAILKGYHLESIPPVESVVVVITLPARPLLLLLLHLKGVCCGQLGVLVNHGAHRFGLRLPPPLGTAENKARVQHYLLL